MPTPEPSVSSDNPRTVFSPKNITEFPAMYWSPKGEHKVFHKKSDVPAGWKPYHPASAAEREAVAQDDAEEAPAWDSAPKPLRTDGPTLAEFVAAGYLEENYPPQGYAAKEPVEPAPKPPKALKPARLGASE